MLKKFFVLFYRNVLRSKFQFFTILTGLSLGMAVSVLIYIYVREERNFDSFHRDIDSMYRINTVLDMEGKTDRTAKAALNTGESLMEFYPDVTDHTQVLNVSKQTIHVGDNYFTNEKVVYADSNFFAFFSFPLLKGDVFHSLDGPGKAVLSASLAKQYFGTIDNAFEKTIEVNKKDFFIAAIFDDRVGQTHMPYSMFLSLSSLPKEFLAERNREYMWLTTYNYIKLKEGIAPRQFEEKLIAFNQKILAPYVKKNEVNGSIKFEIEPVRNIHLNNTLRFDYKGAINPSYLKIFSAVAILTLLIALINYINLTTAKVSKRVREVGIKKFLGATRARLFGQFVMETILTSVISFIIAILLIYPSLHELNNLTGSNYTFSQIFDKGLILSSGAFILLFGLIGSVYPALLLSSFKPLNAIRAYNNKIESGIERVVNPAFVRRILVAAQFTISIFLIVGTIFIFQQFRFMSSRNLGFEKNQVMVIDIPNDTTLSAHLDVIKNSLLGIKEIKSVSCSSSIPGSDHGALTMNVSQSGGSEIKVINIYNVDDKFTETLGIPLVEGRFFSREFSSDPKEAFVINEAAAKFLGWDNPLEKKIESPFGQKGTVVGVLKDFNYKSLHSSIEPLILMYYPSSQGYLLIKAETNDLANTMAQVGRLWARFDRNHPYEYFFLDEEFQAQYIKEQRLIAIFAYFSAFAIFISCLGLIGLAIFTNEARVKEIGIRKTLGASAGDIIRLLSKGFLIPIGVATVFAWMISLYLVNDWLSQFAYRVDVTMVPFILGAGIAFLIAALTIGYFALKAAKQDIVSSLRYE